MTDQSVREGSSGTPGAAPAGATIMPPADPSAPLLPQASGKPAGTRLGFSNYLGLAGALLAMIVLFSLLAPGGSPAFLIVVAVVLDTYRSRRKRA